MARTANTKSEPTFLQNLLWGAGIRSNFRRGIVHPARNAASDLRTLWHAAFGHKKKTIYEQAQNRLISGIQDTHDRYAVARAAYQVTTETERENMRTFQRLVILYTFGAVLFPALALYEGASGIILAAPCSFALLFALRAFAYGYCHYAIRNQRLGNLLTYALHPAEWIPYVRRPPLLVGMSVIDKAHRLPAPDRRVLAGPGRAR